MSETPVRAEPAAALRRLGELRSPGEVRAQAPGIAAAELDLDRVLLSTVRHGELIPEHLHAPVGDTAERALLEALRAKPVALARPLAEAELVRRASARIVSDRRGYGHALGWSSYVAAPVAVDGQVIGFLHGCRLRGGRDVEDVDADNLESFALSFALVFERAVLRHRLRTQRQVLQRIVVSAEAGYERTITLTDDGGDPVPRRPEPPGDLEGLRDVLTRREIDVLDLIARGDTNAGIARALVLSEGTVKFHVKNILRKLGAANRAEASSRYLRMTLHRERPSLVRG
ncbi:response regulator transcription factor [Pseudonocardia sp.]|uniref:helix-turn-helix transcriptional regulator n=1 Tax=Pseudonocardia sp. TaxID=60912 RepID=UPI003D0AEB24